MEPTFSRCLRPSLRDESGFPPRANPRTMPEPNQTSPAPEQRCDSRYPRRCNPDRTKSPLDEGRKELASRYLPLARAMARRTARALPGACDDLESAAYLALVEAAQSFDDSRNVDFAAFARHRIEGALRDVRREFLERTWPLHGRAIEFGQAGRDVESRSWILGGVQAAPVGAELEAQETVHQWIRKLPRLQSQAFRHIYLEGKTQEEAAALIGCSPSTLCRLHKDAIATIQYSGRLG